MLATSGIWCIRMYTFGSELEDGPTAIAKSDRADLLEPVFLLQGLDAGFDLGEAHLFAVTAEEFLHVEFAAMPCLRGDDCTCKTVESLV